MKNRIKTLVILLGMSLCFFGSVLLLLSEVLKLSSKFSIIAFVMIIISYLCSIFGFFYCIVHATTNKKFNTEQKVLHSILIIIFRKYYIPIYYCFNVIKKKKPIGILVSISYFFACINLVISIFGVSSVDYINSLRKKVVVTNDNLVMVTLDNDYVCEDIMGYNGIECSNMYNKLTVYTFSNNENEEILFQVHYEDIIRGLEESGINVIVVSEESNYVVLQEEESERKIIVELKRLNNELFAIIEFDTRSGDDSYYFNNISENIVSNTVDSFM